MTIDPNKFREYTAHRNNYTEIRERARALQIACVPPLAIFGYTSLALGMNPKVEGLVNDLAKKTGKSPERVRRLVMARAVKLNHPTFLRVKKCCSLIAFFSLAGILATEKVIAWAVKKEDLQEKI